MLCRTKQEMGKISIIKRCLLDIDIPKSRKCNNKDCSTSIWAILKYAT